MSENSSPISEMRVTGHMMKLERGLYCVVLAPAAGADPVSGLPGVRISTAPGSAGRPEAVMVAGFRDDGWLTGMGDATLVRVAEGPAEVMVTVYQDPATGTEAAPRIQVLRLMDKATPTAAAAAPVRADLMGHVQGRGDVGVRFGEWLGDAESQRWIEGFAIAPMEGIEAADIEYQAVLGRGWLSPWVEAGQFCGSRGMALPLLGLRLRLRGVAAERFEASCTARFTDGTEIGPVPAGAAVEAESLAPLEAFRIDLVPRAG